MSNFSFLQHEFSILHPESVKSESNIMDDPEVSAIYARKSLENSVKFIYKIDEDLDEKLIVDTDLFGLIKDRSFLEVVPSEYIDEMHYIRKLGNAVVHSNKPITSKDSLYANQCLYKFQRWVVEVYSDYDVLGEYDVLKFTREEVEDKETVIEQTEEQKKLEEANEKLLAELAKLKEQFEAKPKEEQKRKKERVVKVKDINEKETRLRLIDMELEEAGYDAFNFKYRLDVEYKLTLEDGSTGYADYVIWAEDETPLAVIEAKKFSKSVTAGKHQAKLYTQALEKQFGKDVLTFVTNGRVIEYTNGIYPFREIHSFFPKDELVRALQKKEAFKKNKPSDIVIDDKITDRGYQKRVIGSVLKAFEANQMRTLLVMATGTGKTRVSASLSDVLIRADWVRKVLFLADRKELVRQAKSNFSTYLNETCVNLVQEKDLDNRMHFGTYETVHNLIQKGVYNSAYFDLIIVDEAHRTIYKKYKAIFEYFDSFILGLTATPAEEVHKNTYEFFQTGFEDPTDAYDLARAIEDNNLVDFNPYEIDLGIVKRGIKYADLSDDEKEEFEDKFDEDEEEISSDEINKRVLNKQTNEKVLQYLHEHGYKIDEGNKIGKTIIFAKNKKHAEYIKEVFDLLYPSRADEAEIIHSDISHVESLIDNFKKPNHNPQIAISVDMLDTGIDVPEILNLVFFKPVKSKIKFWQMIGRGTRLCPDIFGEGRNKEKFNIFDFCANFSYFDINAKGESSQKTTSLKERLFLKRVTLLRTVEESTFKDELFNIVQSQVNALDASAYYLKKHRHLIEELQKSDLTLITDEVHNNLKVIAEYVEDGTDFEVQRFQMLILNTQEAIVKDKDNSKLVKEIKERCKIIKSKAGSVNEVKKKVDILDKVIGDVYNLKGSIEDLETVRRELEHLANLSLGKATEAVKTTFSDEITDVRNLSSEDYIDKSTVKTEVQKILDEYINSLYLIKELEKSDLITDNDINEIKHHIFDIDKLIEDKVTNNEEFNQMIYEILNSSKKEVANKIFDNFISAGKYTQKQIELINKIKNVLFGKTHADIHDSIQNVKEVLFSDIHPLSNELEGLSEQEQEDIFSVITLIDKVDNNPKALIESK
ncbi:DEAD/DEAH box helicase family protein [Candidatus Sulfurimonas marisnigri]|uniref:DEAD/DEAH box helicase family protein n=1 Tax=Candidatus Sulfurimonas marisnigri TaxID=2740405 RepID=A0A7S7M2V6_9BACT|nr:DEAD/DEAH box helicase family protein [Candidatus Sulfurimonas marisnigri]QOY55324.1 DEAD/DEAH box helicase family protein [Candidatus Sulfurimonas marisnigri]